MSICKRAFAFGKKTSTPKRFFKTGKSSINSKKSPVYLHKDHMYLLKNTFCWPKSPSTPTLFRKNTAQFKKEKRALSICTRTKNVCIYIYVHICINKHICIYTCSYMYLRKSPFFWQQSPCITTLIHEKPKRAQSIRKRDQSLCKKRLFIQKRVFLSRNYGCGDTHADTNVHTHT